MELRDNVDVRETVEATRLPQSMDLYAGEWWSAGRTPSDIAKMLQATDLVVALVDQPNDQLVGFARVLTDDTYLAVILDVIIAPEWRHLGLGAMLLEVIVEHPRLAAVQSLELVCQPEVMSFYRRWGFTDKVGQSRLMRRTSDPLLAGA